VGQYREQVEKREDGIELYFTARFVQQIHKHPMDSAIITVYCSGRRCVLESILKETERRNFLCTCKLTGIIKLLEAKGRESWRGTTSYMWDLVRPDFMAVSCPQPF
jgi:hypothetical protein